jgi:hypothetical protein
MKPKKICSIRELKKLSKDGYLNCYISLMGGGCRSSKSIQYDPAQNVFSVFNEIDGSIDILTVQELYKFSNIGEAIKKGALYIYR